MCVTDLDSLVYLSICICDSFHPTPQPPCPTFPILHLSPTPLYLSPPPASPLSFSLSFSPSLSLFRAQRQQTQWIPNYPAQMMMQQGAWGGHGRGMYMSVNDTSRMNHIHDLSRYAGMMPSGGHFGISQGSCECVCVRASECACVHVCVLACKRGLFCMEEVCDFEY